MTQKNILFSQRNVGTNQKKTPIYWPSLQPKIHIQEKINISIVIREIKLFKFQTKKVLLTVLSFFFILSVFYSRSDIQLDIKKEIFFMQLLPFR